MILPLTNVVPESWSFVAVNVQITGDFGWSEGSPAVDHTAYPASPLGSGRVGVWAMGFNICSTAAQTPGTDAAAGNFVI